MTKEDLKDFSSSFDRIFEAQLKKFFGKKTFNREDPEGASRITSNSNTSEEKSTPTSVQLGSSFQVLNQVESKVRTISTGADKAK
ncbi:hypothetical protein C5167_036605 [Papaver somniferum]|uniref:Uncharacterized protein n=1 Tax=Papaver somniferum TaxID=3469 RepID=A0A4Y7I457_PAPSO|nr:hypothetical protein C5167_036605 [Papaver somniferum]